MTISDIRNAMFNDGNMIYFSYNGKECGADIEGHFSAFRFLAWCGPKSQYYSSFDEMANDEIFDGYSLITLLKFPSRDRILVAEVRKTKAGTLIFQWPGLFIVLRRKF